MNCTVCNKRLKATTVEQSLASLRIITEQRGLPADQLVRSRHPLCRLCWENLERALQPAQSALNLLTRDGTMHVVFEPALSAVQHTQLMEFVNAIATTEELRVTVEAWARAEGLRVVV
jgi:hypothetical protein